ncbi:MAG: RluA family pseudouridine synthase [Bacteroides sp.]|nr:RluA family pseudouridine synthase [Bacteroides sp.]
MKKPRQTARARTQYTNYPVRTAMELMDFLAAKMPDASRNKLKLLLSKRVVYVDHVITTQYNFPLKPGMLVQISKEKGKKEFHSNYMQLLYEDAYLLVINKKENLPSTAGKGRERTTLSILREYVQRSGKERRVYPVQKLDRDASGIMIYAKDEKTQKKLQEYWQRSVQEYKFTCVVRGELEQESGTIFSWVTDDQIYVSHSTSALGGGDDKAITRYKRIKITNNLSMVELHPQDVRKNQVRLHMNDLGHPIVGDIRYDPEAQSTQRLALHGFRLIFQHPVTGERMKFETPYPESFRKMVARPVKKEEKSEEGASSL